MPQGPSSSQTPYLVAEEPNVRFVSIATSGDTIGTGLGGSPYRFVGVPDGIGAFDNGDGTITVLVNHEIGATQGIVHAHGSAGAFVSQLIVDKTTLAVTGAQDAIRTLMLFNPATDTYSAGTTAFARFCSSDLANQTAFYNAATGLGTQQHIYLTGEESGPEGRAIGIIASGPGAGTTYELASLGNLSFENLTANPFAQNKTIVAATDDGVNGQVYIYIGEKQAGGTAIEQAGLIGGAFYGITIAGVADETNATAVAGRFSLTAIGPNGDASDLTGTQIDALSEVAGVTSFLRPEDSAWDPTHPNTLYFTTTNSFDGNSRLYRATFDDITNPTAGGTIEAVLDGSEGYKMLDNLTITPEGKIILLEDVGNNPRVGKVWEYDIATDKLVEIAQHDPARFTPPTPAPFNQDEESSGVIDVTDLLGDADTKAFLIDVQAHFNTDAETVQGGQLLAMYIDDVVETGTAAADTLRGSAADENFRGFAGNDTILAGSGNDTADGGLGNDTIDGGAGDDQLTAGEGDDQVQGGLGNDQIWGNGGVDLLDGGAGDDVINAGAGNDQVLGGIGNDKIGGGEGDDTLDGGAGDDQIDGGIGNDIVLGGEGNDKLAGGIGNDVITGGLGADDITGGAGNDRFVFTAAADSSVAASDIIRGFADGDLIELSAIDARAGGADDAFTLVSAFSGTAGELVVTRTGGSYAVAGDIDGDGTADFRIVLLGASGTIDAADFVL